MTEQEKFYKFVREILECIVIGFGLGMLVFLALIVWIAWSV